MTIIDSETVVVYNFNELKSVLEGNTYNYVYFGDNITLGGGINVNLSRTNLTIDGTYNNIRYTYTDYPSSAYTQTILLSGGTSSMNITVKNIDVVGRNYYGVICVYDSANFTNVVVTYENMDYEGPQMAFNPYSSLRIINCNINIISNVSSANEVAETRNVTLGGNVTINSVTTGTSVFWLRNVVGGVYPYINVLPGANVYINTVNRYLYYVSSAAYINMTFGSGSVSNIITSTGMGYDNGHLTNDVLIDNDAVLHITQTTQFGSTATWRVRGEFRMNDSSSLKMVSNYIGTTGNYCLEFTGASASLFLNNPKSVIFYNLGTNALNSTATIPYTLNISQFNRWTAVTSYATAGDIYDIPTYSWYKIENINNLVIQGTITSTTTTISSINLTSGEQTELPALTNLILNNTRVMSMGRPSLSINPITDLSTDITGITAANADVRITYLGNDYYVQADGNGNFSYSYFPSLPIGTEISFVSNVANSFLYRFRTVEIIYPGDLFIKAASNQITFSTTPFQTSPTLCQRSSPLKVIVEDSRITPSVWKLYASINSELTNEKGNVLTDGLVFVDNIGNMEIFSSDPVLVYTSDGVTTGEIEVEWQADEGILLQLNVVPIVAKTTYKTDINWSIE
ncbi:MAG TPA: hypothetical protein GX747_04660 [Tenericutes bacterium]|nr:hypothetical protein [Mycoplasmatota bacterium]